MNTAVISLVLLIATIAIGFLKKLNVGILAIFIAFVFGNLTGTKDSNIIAGFGTSLFIILLGITLLCGIAQANGSIDLFAKKCTALVGKQTWLAPVIIWLIGCIIPAMGPGSIPALGIICAIAVPFSKATGYDAVMMCLIGEIGVFAGRFSPITTDCSVIANAANPQGYSTYGNTLLLSALIVSILLSIMIFIIFKGYKVKSSGELKMSDLPRYDKNQILTLIGFCVMVFITIVFKKNVGLCAFAVSSVLILLGVADEKNAITRVPWGTLIMVTGVGMLMNLVIAAGGIDLLSNMLSSIMTASTAAAITGAIAGIMSWFSSATGVVFPTMIPTVSTIVENVGGNVNPDVLITMISICAAYAGLSPASTGGGLIIAARSTDPDFSKEEQTKLFGKLFAISALCLLVIVLLAFIGFFNLFV